MNFQNALTNSGKKIVLEGFRIQLMNFGYMDEEKSFFSLVLYYKKLQGSP